MSLTSIRISLSAGLVAVALASAVFALEASTALSADPAGSTRASGQGVAVALGDSFVSGEGARWLGNAAPGGGPSSWGTDRLCLLRWWGCQPRPGGVYRGGPTAACHRSDVASIEVATLGVGRRYNLACSGARAADVYRRATGGPAESLPSQVERLAAIARSRHISVVLISVGANDLGFSSIVRACAKAWFSGDRGGCRAFGNETLSENLPGMRRRLRNALAAVVSTMEEAGQPRGRWQFVVQGYSSPLPSPGNFRYPQESTRRLSPGGCPFTDADVSWTNGTMMDALDRELSGAAALYGARFLGLSGAFDGHRVCDRRARLAREGGPSGSGSEWFRFLVPCCGGLARESLHPNAFGHRAMGACLALFIQAGSGNWDCRPRADSGPSVMRLEPR